MSSIFAELNFMHNLSIKQDTTLTHHPLCQTLGSITKYLLAILCILATSSAKATNMGTVCIGKVETATAGSKSLSNYTASDTPYEFTVRIGNRSPVATSHTNSVLVNELAMENPHKVVIKRNDKPFTAFTIRFANYENGKLCLWFSPFYELWSVWPISPQTSGKCSCSIQQ